MDSARATSAALPFFKAFEKADTRSSYIDGGLYHNNPVWVAHHERKLIWGDVAGAPPDLLLSVGTGTNTSDQDSNSSQSRLPLAEGQASSPKPKARPPKTSGFLPRLMVNVGIERIENLLRCNDTWRDFMAENTGSDYDVNDNHRRFIRINPDLRSDVPKLDQVKELNSLEKAAAKYLAQNRTRIREVAHRLIASTFFFEKRRGSVKQLANSGGFECEGER